jgi:hypothetical protein
LAGGTFQRAGFRRRKIGGAFAPPRHSFRPSSVNALKLRLIDRDNGAVQSVARFSLNVQIRRFSRAVTDTLAREKQACSA